VSEFVKDSWSGIMIRDNTPLKHIPNLMVRHMIFQILAWMWCIIFSAALGSFVVFGVSLIAHVLLIAGITITYSTFQVAKRTSQRGATQYRGAD
tara:strand:- start:123 stop:404 length:282 start_codon:yes stop_codon:yes gene_type:complete